MCIRDRGQTILRGKEWRSDSVSFSGGMMVWILYAPEDGSEERCIDGWIPVSYTHLDVYKRQA